jgi:diguanylate cyclase
MADGTCPSPPATLAEIFADALAGDPLAAGFEVYYQPIVRFADSATVAVEALARWWHPILGNINTTVFVAIAESIGLAGALDDFVLDRACADANALASAYGRAVDLHVNVSASRLGQRELELAVARALDRYRVSPGRLILEITETTQIVDLRAAIDAANRLREQGVRIALDDFGTGFNWLGRLYALPLDAIKLDGTSTPVEDWQCSETLCGPLLILFNELDLMVVAEGIETGWQADAWARLGCRLGQGYLYGPPEPLRRLEQQCAHPYSGRTWLAGASPLDGSVSSRAHSGGRR